VPSVRTAAWGYPVETATQGIWLVLSGVFNDFPELKIILGHTASHFPSPCGG
jgi:predicted TIM-barrel fold metal-dependent hydrolase